MSGGGSERKKAWAPISRDRYISTAPRSEATEEAAYQAETFVASRYGLEVNRVHRDDGTLQPLEPGDIVLWYRGREVIIDVKWTKYLTGVVVTWLDARVKADIYILVVGPIGGMRIVGWTSGDDHRARFGDLGHGPRHVTTQEQLSLDTDDLMTRLGHPPVGLEPEVPEGPLLEQATRERDAIEQAWQAAGQWPRVWTTPAARSEWIAERVRGLKRFGS